MNKNGGKGRATLGRRAIGKRFIPKRAEQVAGISVALFEEGSQRCVEARRLWPWFIDRTIGQAMDPWRECSLDQMRFIAEEGCAGAIEQDAVERVERIRCFGPVARQPVTYKSPARPALTGRPVDPVIGDKGKAACSRDA